MTFVIRVTSPDAVSTRSVIRASPRRSLSTSIDVTPRTVPGALRLFRYAAVCDSACVMRAPAAPHNRGRLTASSFAAFSVPSSSPPAMAMPSGPPSGYETTVSNP